MMPTVTGSSDNDDNKGLPEGPASNREIASSMMEETMPSTTLSIPNGTSTTANNKQQEDTDKSSNNKNKEHPLWLKCDRYKAESLLRIAISVIVGCTLTVSETLDSTYVPHNAKYLIGWFASILSIFYPKLVFTLIGVTPSFSTMTVWTCCITTFLYVICENYGRDWFVVAYGLYVFFMTALFFGDTYQKTTKEACFYLGVTSMVTIQFLNQLDYPENINYVNNVPNATLLTATEMWTEKGVDNPKAIFRNFLVLWCYALLCIYVMVLIPFPRTARSMFTKTMIPNVIEEIIDYISIKQRGSSFLTTDNDDIEAQNQQQKQQQHRKMVHLSYEFRGMRKVGLTKYEPRIWMNEDLVKPLAKLMNDLNTLCRISLLRHAEEVPGVLAEENAEINNVHAPSTRGVKGHRRMPLILELCSSALRNDATDTDLEILRNSLSGIERYTKAMEERRKRRSMRNKKSNDSSRQSNSNNNSKGNGNGNNNNNDDSSSSTLPVTSVRDNASVDEDDDDIIINNAMKSDLNIVSEHETLHSYGTRFYIEKVDCLKRSTIEYLDYLYGNTKQKMTFKEILMNRIEFNLMWMIEPILSIATRLFNTIYLLIQPSRWDWHTSVWSIKYALGYVLLFALDVYFPNYATLGVGAGQQSVYTANSHNAWQILGYAMAWRPTVEGTFKKGLMRLGGTIFGGFIGWIGVIVCQGFSYYDVTAPMNPYGTVVWTTVFTTVAAYLSIDAGPQGLFGSTYSHGFLGFYFAMVQSLVMLSVYTQPGTRDACTVTRVVATAVGVLLAMIIQLIPPNIYGRYPQDIVPCLNEIKLVFNNTIDAALSLHNPSSANDDNIDSNDVGINSDLSINSVPSTRRRSSSTSASSETSSSSSLYETLIVSGHQREEVARVHKLIDHRLFLAKDSGTLSFLPLMKLDVRIILLLEEITLTLDYMSRLERIVSGLKDNPDRDHLVNELRDVMKLGKPAPVHHTRRRSSMVNNGDGIITEEIIDDVDTSGNKNLNNVLDGTFIVPGVTKLVENRLLDHERALQFLISSS